MIIHHKLANLLGYDLVRHKKSHQSLKDHFSKVLDKYSINVVLDVGANEGQFASELREKGFSGHIISFEPTKEAFAKIEQKAKTDPNWHIFNYALGQQEESLTINVTKSTVLSSFSNPNEDCKDRFQEGAEIASSYEVQVKRLDAVLPQIIKDIKAPSIFLKIDTQGFDINVFKGAKEVLGQIKGLISEVSMRPIYSDTPDYLTALETYTNEGFFLTGMYPVSRDDDSLTVIEFDAVMVRPNTSKFSSI